MATSGKSFGKLLGKFLRKKPKKEKQKHAVSEEEELNMGSDSVNDDDLPVDQDPLSVIPIFDMSDVFVIDRQAKASLSKVYEHVKYMVKELPKEMCTLLSRLYDDVDSKLNNQLSALSEKCTIVVAGKSNPGMNSFMKTILGSDVIPNPRVLSPGTTCCVHSIPSDVEEYFVIQMENGPSERHSYPKDSDSFQGLLCDIMQGKTSHQIDLYCNLPAFGNVENVTILRIDGEENLLQTQMVEWVGDTLILIYVVDSASFDDAYDCKLMQLCKQFLSETRAGTFKKY
ncbi:hypothetical protein DPMN_155542 [Dreissena polymorpha]|uniref:Uncharacterized protein n=1 Tax=Dreissena polymorpha TaxID=45954 RepID=A0A9D4FN54_DREPO|nr:hypothetical protein DPMN_155542 [Dreissena polymorpha]